MTSILKVEIDNTYQLYRRKHFMFLRLQELVHQNKYDNEKALKMFDYLSSEQNKRRKKMGYPAFTKEERRDTNIELRSEFEDKDREWREEAKSLFPDRYRKVFNGWHSIGITPAEPSKKQTRRILTMRTKERIPNVKDVRFRRKNNTVYNIQVQYKEGGRQAPQRTVSR